MAKIRYENFQDESADSIYPFVKQHPRSLDRTFVLPSGVILDAALHVPGSIGYYTLIGMTVSDDTVTFEVRNSVGGAAKGTWKTTQKNTNCIDLYTQSYDPAGVLFVDPTEMRTLLSVTSSGTQVFDVASAVFAPATYHYVPAHQDPALLVSGTLISPDEDIIIRGHNGVYIECNENDLKLHAVGDPRGKRTVCDDTFIPDTFIKEVVFQHNDQTIRCAPVDGNIVLAVVSDGDETALRMQQANNEIRFDLVAAKK